MPIAETKRGIQPPPKRLSALRRATLTGIGEYSRFVRLMKRALPAAAAGVALVVVALALQPREAARITMTYESQQSTGGADLTMTHPRLSGTDDSGSPFVVTARSATQDGPQALKVRLNEVDAQLTMKDGLWVRLESTRGYVNSETHQLDITEHVRLTADGGYEAHSEAAHFDLTTGIVNGHTPVYGRGPYGTFTSHGFEVHKEQKQLVLTGGVSMLLHAAEPTR